MNRLYVHPLPVRIWHWINAFSVLSLIITGVQIRYIGLIDVVSLELAVSLHNWIGFALLGNFFLWLSFYLFSDKIGIYHPELNPKKYYREAWRQMRYYGWGIFKGAPNPHHISANNKFNPLQRVSYQIIMLLILPVQIFTGVLLWDIERFSGAVALLGGVRIVDTVHVLLFIFFVGFLFVHVYLATLGHTATAHIKAMFTGYEETDEDTDAAVKDRESEEVRPVMTTPVASTQLH